MAAATFGTVWIFVGRIAYPVPPEFTNKLPISTSGCGIDQILIENITSITETFNTSSIMATTYDVTTMSLSSSTMSTRPPIADLYAISYLYLTGFGFCFGMVVGLIVSLLSGEYKCQ